MADFIQTFFRTEGYHPHGFCYMWQPGLVWLHVISDALIGMAYLAIGASLAIFVHRSRELNLPFSRIFIAFGVFIAACGATHFMSIWTLWSPIYWLSGSVKVLTAAASVLTALVLPPLIPAALATLTAARASEKNRRDLEGANKQLKHLDELKTQFFANVSHELRTPLTLILGPVGQVLSEGRLDEQDRRRLELVEQNGEFLLRQVNDLLDVAKLEAGRMELDYERADLAHLARLCAANFESLATLRGLSPLSVEAPEQAMVEMDGQKVRRVIFNLLANAIEFTPAGGSVSLRVFAPEKGGGADMRDGTVRIEVHDSGPGVPPDEREHIFEPFRQAGGAQQSRRTGTGLGLAIVSELVHLHGGAIWVEESPAGDAAFIVTLPERAPDGVPVRAGAALEAGEDAGRIYRPRVAPVVADLEAGHVEGDERPVVLVVEDHPDMSRFIVETLGDAYRVSQAYDGRSGVERAKDIAPDLILSDIMMPELSGEQLVASVRADPSLSNVPILLLSARADEDLRLKLLKGGAQDYLTKPFSAEELRVRVANWIGMKRARDILQDELDSTMLDVEDLAREIRSRKRDLEQALDVARGAAAEAERANRAKSDFLGIMSHELRTPLNAIFGYVDLLETGVGGDLNDRQKDYAVRVRRSAGHLLSLVDEILTFARIEAGVEKPEEQFVDLRIVISDATSLMEPEVDGKNLDFRVLLPDMPVRAHTDPNRLSRVVLNLISNAVKFTEAGEVTVSLREEAGSALVEVKDTGAGIPESQYEAIFEPFWQMDSSMTRKAGGTGLGLSIARELTRLLGGDLSVRSEVGVGSAFTVTLPVRSATDHDGDPSA